MISLSDILENNNGSLRAINKQLKAKYENERVNLMEYKDTSTLAIRGQRKLRTSFIT